jgi:hypothetical protein
MRFARFVRTLAPFAMLGLVGLVLGCSGQPDSTPVDKDAGKKIAEEIKSSRQEQKAERLQAKGATGKKGRDARQSQP